MLTHETEVTLQPEDWRLFWPFAAQADLQAMILALLVPTQDHNAVVLAAVDAITGPWDATPATVVPLFLADPFLHLQKTATALQARGLTRVMALPAVGQWGRGFGNTLQALNLGAAREMRQLSLLTDLGLDPIQTICTQAPLPEILASDVVVVPTLLDAETPDLVSQQAARVHAAAPGRRVYLLQSGPVLVPFIPRAPDPSADTSGSG